ncbi:MAG: DUF2177 family protein [Candidatus Pacebacteria bacterium]|jgi:uncharacterized membrane protein|nr:DUF2177 family protein [Candidatus Paceibacterota bacterium]MBT3511762.1 DUF2177 family protein [Candidatus Paceibacterota bacterium]MBT4005187.1 DUF2177 family protein [Candidatus Paceibacterota bacterium]MBT4359013.1 DUF2177 family protein [Candidatus Paceibacterota bacterium]MBT4681288.1 DUF2177 family protein [Candidatus Paceibacterota bacterium]
MKFLLTTPFLKIWLITVVIFIVLDMLWLGVFSKGFYNKHLGYLANKKNDSIVFNLPVGIVTQAIIATGLAILISLGIQVENTLLTAVLVGAISGFVIYATYDLTNQSFIKDWPWMITIIDICWGTFQGTAAGFYIWWLWSVVK